MLAFLAVCFLLANLFTGSTAADFIMPFNGGLKPNTLVTVYLEVPQSTTRFTIDFVQDNKNTQFHLNPRFNYGRTMYTSANCMINGAWGAEIEKLDNFPFKLGKKFKIDIECLQDSYKVYVDDKFYIQYQCPMKPVEKVNFIGIWGANVEYVSASPMQS
ncbi:galectin-3-like [Lissotriton helveticus]